MECMAGLTCDVSTLPLGFASTSCQNMTFPDACVISCQAGFSGSFGDNATFSCQSNGSFTGSADCSPIVTPLASGGEGQSSVSGEVTFAVTQNAHLLVSELVDPSSNTSSALTLSFKNALQLPDRVKVMVLSAQLNRRLEGSRRMQPQSISVLIEFSRLTAADATVLANNLALTSTTDGVVTQLQSNFRQLAGVDVGAVTSLSVSVVSRSDPVAEPPVTEPPKEENGVILAGAAICLGIVLASIGCIWLCWARRRRYRTKLEEEKSVNKETFRV